ncbi:MAG TPA: arginase family protein, partial [Longimicrobiales bacterium]
AVSVASRDDYQIRASSSGELRVEDSAIRAFPLDAIRRESARAVAASAMTRLSERGVDGVWIHFDVDALDSTLMPAVDSPEPGGLTADEAVELLDALVAHPLARGLQVTIYDPDRDPDGVAAIVLVDVLVRGLASRARR